jgi:3-deoxy-D-manno-octulosonic-acid transferase
MYLLYSLLLTVGFLVLLPRFAIDALRSRKYITGLRERLGQLPAIPFDNRPLIWIHCVSVGETEAARPLVRALLNRFPSYRLVVSTTTVTGQRIAREAFGREAGAVFYFPIDWVWTVRRVLRRLQPAAVLIMETELWPNLLRECRALSIPVALVNGRISITSFGRYKLIRPFISRVLGNISIALMQSEQDASRIRALGIPNERVLMAGNLKFDSAEGAIDESSTAKIRERFGFDGTERLIVAASTHSPEEDVVIQAFKQIRSSEPEYRVRLLIAPRHPERFDEVASLLQDSGLRWARRSDAVTLEDRACDVVLLDSIGELRAVYPLADVAFVGGSIVPHGGHNALEPAARGVCVVTGAHTHNFAAVTKALLNENAIIQLSNDSTSEARAELASTLKTLLSNDSQRREMGQRAMGVCNRNRGATERTVQMIAKLLDTQAVAGESLHFPAVPVTAAK